MIWLGITIPVLAFIGLYLIIDGVLSLLSLIKLNHIHKQITKLLEDDKNEQIIKVRKRN